MKSFSVLPSIHRSAAVAVTILAVLLLPGVSIAGFAEPSPARVFEVGSYPGETAARVLHFRRSHSGRQQPVVMVPGLGLPASIYIRTPDDRDGWVTAFLDAGYEVYVIEFPSSARWQEEQIWPRWGFGPTPGDPYPNVKFPTDSIDAFLESLAAVPATAAELAGRADRAGGGRQPAESDDGERSLPADGASLVELLAGIDPAILVVHSMGGSTAYQAVIESGVDVAAIVSVEPVGSPTDPEIIDEVFASIGMLYVYGDYIAERNQTGRLEASRETVELVREAGGRAEVLDLPARGIVGNTHLLMQDSNSDSIAELVIEWLHR